MKITAYKAFNADWTCRGMQYAVGQAYTHNGPVKICESGIHACELAMDVWAYYPLGSPVAVVELDATDETHNDSKRVGAAITINREIGIRKIVEASVAWITARAGSSSDTASSGYSSSLASSGYGSSLASSGDESSLASSGNESRLASSGDSSNLASSGNESRLASSGYSSRLASSGYGSSLASSGDSSIASAGPNGCFALVWHDGKRPRFTVGYVGEGGIEPNVAYRCDDNGKLVRA